VPGQGGALWRHYGLERWNLPGRFDRQTQGAHRERRGEPYAGKPHVQFDEGPPARAS
jgi:hypothetical protein